MAITGRAVTAGGGGIANRLDFTYTGGTFNERTADGVVEFLETGILCLCWFQLLYRDGRKSILYHNRSVLWA